MVLGEQASLNRSSRRTGTVRGWVDPELETESDDGLLLEYINAVTRRPRESSL